MFSQIFLTLIPFALSWSDDYVNDFVDPRFGWRIYEGKSAPDVDIGEDKSITTTDGTKYRGPFDGFGQYFQDRESQCSHYSYITASVTSMSCIASYSTKSHQTFWMNGIQIGSRQYFSESTSDPGTGLPSCPSGYYKQTFAWTTDPTNAYERAYIDPLDSSLNLYFEYQFKTKVQTAGDWVYTTDVTVDCTEISGVQPAPPTIPITVDYYCATGFTSQGFNQYEGDYKKMKLSNSDTDYDYVNGKVVYIHHPEGSGLIGLEPTYLYYDSIDGKYVFGATKGRSAAATPVIATCSGTAGNVALDCIGNIYIGSTFCDDCTVTLQDAGHSNQCITSPHQVGFLMGLLDLNIAQMYDLGALMVVIICSFMLGMFTLCCCQILCRSKSDQYKSVSVKELNDF